MTDIDGHAVSGGRKSSGGPLALKRELRELGSQVESREREADTLTGTLEELEKRFGEHDEKFILVFEAIRQLTRIIHHQ